MGGREPAVGLWLGKGYHLSGWQCPLMLMETGAAAVSGGRREVGFCAKRERIRSGWDSEIDWAWEAGRGKSEG